MKAKVIAIESGSRFKDGQNRITIHFEDADSVHSSIRVPQSVLGTTVELDEEIGVELKLQGLTVVAQ